MKQRIKDIMKPSPVSLERSASLKSVVELISTQGFSHIPVVENGFLLGIVSKTDLIKKFLVLLDETSGKYYSKMLLEHLKVDSIMKEDPLSIHEEDDVDYATELLLQGEFHGLIVLNKEEKVSGVVTAFDILKAKTGI